MNKFTEALVEAAKQKPMLKASKLKMNKLWDAIDGNLSVKDMENKFRKSASAAGFDSESIEKYLINGDI